MYVRPFARRQGYSLALLHTLTSELPPGDHLGLSHPVSLSMCKVMFQDLIEVPLIEGGIYVTPFVVVYRTVRKNWKPLPHLV
ncbi:hypothetical protein E2C01_086850 [Portunus trituberculatus]|uniref:Uncharacterized protein n=1 Tax=Portunus trituberculatus TaxID=210409 RepID=A0A5B7J1X7_PORTR|nr:hypothetical protein [Portunus trituberculatus]